MRNSDYRKFIGFMMLTIIFLFAGFLLGTAPMSFILNNELGDIYWGIILPIFALFIMIIFFVSLITYMASWIYLAKTKGRSRWFGLLGIIPVLGPLILIGLKNKLPREGEEFHVIATAFIGAILPVIVLFSFFSVFSDLKSRIEILAQQELSSQSTINATVKGAYHEKK